jgi:hypothetical protein
MAMDKRRTTIGHGVRRETIDPTIAEAVARARDHVVEDDAIRVEDLSAAEFAQLQVKAALDDLVKAKDAMTVATTAFDAAWLTWLDAKAEEERLNGEA